LVKAPSVAAESEYSSIPVKLTYRLE